MKNKLEIVPVKWIDRVLEVALERVPEALPEQEPTKVVEEAAKPAAPTAGSKLLTTH